MNTSKMREKAIFYANNLDWEAASQCYQSAYDLYPVKNAHSELQKRDREMLLANARRYADIAASEKKANEPKERAELWDAMKYAPSLWQETTEAMYSEMLNVLPPAAMGSGGFLVGEAYRHNTRGEAIYACFTRQADHTRGQHIYQARYMTVAEFATWAAIHN